MIVIKDVNIDSTKFRKDTKHERSSKVNRKRNQE